MYAGELSRCRAVVIGGGTGAPVSIRALLSLGVQTSAVVAMADDGGSTGILRERAGAIPPGDIRKCLVAMAADRDDPLTKAFQYRFDYADNHALGNLVLTALADTAGSFPEAIAICEGLLKVQGHVYPSTLDQVVLSGIARDGMRIDGQVAIGHSTTALERVMLQPTDPVAYAPAVDAIMEADLVVLGPGSLFTSIIPNLLVPEIASAIATTRARTVFVCSLADVQGETWGLNVADYVEALFGHGMRGLLDVVLVQRSEAEWADHPVGMTTQRFAAVTGEGISHDPVCASSRSFHVSTEGVSRSSYKKAARIRRVPVSDALIARIEAQGPLTICRDMADSQRPTWHDPQLLAKAFWGVLAPCRSPQK